jgi:hypothetical protein
MLTPRRVTPAALVLLFFLPAARGADVDPYAPADSEWVLRLNVKQLAAAPVVVKYAAEQLRAGLRAEAALLAPLTALGIDPLKDVESFTAAGSGLPEDRQALLVARGGFDAARLRATADALVKQQPTIWKALKEGDLTVYELSDRSGKVLAYLAVPRAGTVLIAGRRKYVTTAAAADPDKPAKVSEDLRKLVQKADARDDLWLASVTPQRVRKLLARSQYASGIADDVTAFTARLTVGTDLKVAFNVHTKGEKSAEEVAQLLDAARGLAAVAVQGADGLGPLLAELLDASRTSAEGGTATLAGRLSEEQITRALKKK